MKTHPYLIICVVIAASGCSAPDAVRDGPATNIEEVLRTYAKQLERGETPQPLRLTPEQDAQLVAAGILPPSEEHEAPSAFNCKNAPLSIFFDKYYSTLVGKRVAVAKGLRVLVTYTAPPSSVATVDAIRAADEYLKQTGITLVPDGTNRLKAVQMKQVKAQPSGGR